jgi:carboxylesterase type B
LELVLTACFESEAPVGCGSEREAAEHVGATHAHELDFAVGRPPGPTSTRGQASYDTTLADAMSDSWIAFATAGTRTARRRRASGRAGPCTTSARIPSSSWGTGSEGNEGSGG